MSITPGSLTTTDQYWAVLSVRMDLQLWVTGVQVEPVWCAHCTLVLFKGADGALACVGRVLMEIFHV